MKIIKLLTIVLVIIVSSDTFGQSQNALVFDGIDDFVNCGNDASQNLQGNITLEAWINRVANIGSFDRIVGREWETSYSLASGFAANTISFGMDPKANVGNILQSTTTIPLGIWVHVAGTWDGTTLKLYIDGELETSMPYVNASVTGSTIPTYIGKRFIVSAGSSVFPGFIDEVRIWNVARTQTEIRDDMYHEIANPTAIPSLIGYYQFNEGSGQTVEDKSFNTNDGVLGLDNSVGIDDPFWVISTAPIPYYSLSDGFWSSDGNWAPGQNAPIKDWTIAEIKSDININANANANQITVYPIGRLTVSSGITVGIANQFTIKSDATGTGSFISHGTLSSTTNTVERYYTGNEWHLISSPVQAAVSGLFTGLYLQSFDEATNSYNDIIPTTTLLVPGSGFAIWNNSNATAEFNGLLNFGTIGSADNLSRSGAGSVNFGWNLVGNPYTSSVDWDAASGWTKTNVNNATYRHVNASTWATYVGGVGTNGGTRYIAPGQGFFVSVIDNAGAYPENGTLIFDNDTRIHNNTSFYKDEINNLVRLQVSGNGYSDETVIRFTEDATTGFDSDFDAHKLFGYQAEAAQIYSHIDQDYGINAMAEIQAVSVGVKVQQSGSFTVEAIEVSDLEIIILEDLLTNETTDLLVSGYTFEYTPETMDERFILHFSPVAGIQDMERNQAFIFASNGNLAVSIPENQRGTISIYSLNGQQIKTADVEGGMNTIQMDRKGAFIVKVVTDGLVETQKVSLY